MKEERQESRKDVVKEKRCMKGRGERCMCVKRLHACSTEKERKRKERQKGERKRREDEAGKGEKKRCERAMQKRHER